jgi:hypothetical protein
MEFEMPAYDRPIRFNGARQAEPRVGAVIVFKSNDMERIQKFLDSLAERDIVEPTVAHEYDASYGGPVWYIP